MISIQLRSILAVTILLVLNPYVQPAPIVMPNPIYFDSEFMHIPINLVESARNAPVLNHNFPKPAQAQAQAQQLDQFSSPMDTGFGFDFGFDNGGGNDSGSSNGIGNTSSNGSNNSNRINNKSSNSVGNSAAVPSTEINSKSDIDSMKDLVNAQRSMVGKPPLQYSESLSKAALAQSKYQNDIQRMTHENKNFEGLLAKANSFGQSFGSAAENVAYNYPSISAVMDGWVKSTPHLANINGDFEFFGFARDGVYWTQVFAR
ncbi:hypothetical protein AYI68_g6784 [Smittium mucronatum]|uniref:SCP domain-containing protein n=1 Tax=Smittium mucronatum TaxID=133383 RepID=A0A1R0GQK5_9FUNG|nr:hypothetical protein AYI68_g6784 [Smittium mucronatum]